MAQRMHRTLSLLLLPLALLATNALAAAVPDKLAFKTRPGTDRYIVVLERPSLVERMREEVGPGKNLNLGGTIAQAEADSIETDLDAFLATASAELGRTLSPVYRYTHALTGMAVRMTGSEAKRLAVMPMVRSVSMDQTQKLQTFAGPRWIGADRIWSGQGVIEENRGEGVIIGVIDSGANWDHPSFQDPGENGPGYDHTNPYGEQLGLCSEPEVMCNDKLVGVYDFVVDNPDTDVVEEFNNGADNGAHGAHTAGTAAGNPYNISLETGELLELSGVAPNATIVSYRVCHIGDPNDPDDDGCQTSVILEAIDQAIEDGVDVINYSIGSTAVLDPWRNSPTADAYLTAFDAGIFVATSAGNAGRGGNATIGVPANAPWIMAVGAASHGVVFGGLVNTLSGGASSPPGTLQGRTLTPEDLGERRIVHARDFGNALCGTGPAELQPSCGANTGASNPFPEGTFDGEIVVCDRGTYGRIEKGKNVLEAGAGGYILINTSGEAVEADDHCLPAVHLGEAAGDLLSDWLATGDNHRASISGFQLIDDDRTGDQLADFSSRGPNPGIAADVLKPNLIAPGDLIFAAAGEGLGTIGIGGTSMASPHVAGAAALMLAANPDLTPSQVSSMLQLTATAEVAKDTNGGPADPHDTGAGRPVLQDAIRAVLYLEEDRDAFRRAWPTVGGDPTTLNLPSLGDSECLVECSFTREIGSLVDGRQFTVSTSGFPAGAKVTVSPSSFTSSTSATQTLEVTVDLKESSVLNDWVFGNVHLTASGVPQSTLPVAVFAEAGTLPERFDIDSAGNAGSQTESITDLAALANATYITGGLVAPDDNVVALREDPTADDPFDDPDQVFTVFYDVPPNALWLQANTPASPAEDLDLFVGYDANNNGVAELEELVCISADFDDVENCDVIRPISGRWWVIMQNWEDGVDEAPGAGPAQDVRLISALVVQEADGSLSATGPGITQPLEAFDLRLAWDNFDAREGQTYFGAVGVGSTSSAPTNLGIIPVRVTRTALAEPETTALFDGRETAFALAAESAHEFLFIDVPPDTSALDVTVSGASASENDDLSVDLYRVDFDDAFASAPGVPAAPGGSPEASASGSAGNGPSVTVDGGVTAGRWYAVVRNGGSESVSITVTAELTAGASPINVYGGLWEPTSRPGIRQGFEYTPAGPNRAALWYTYELDGAPVWYLASGPASDGNSWTADLLRFTNDGEDQQFSQVGAIAITMLGESDSIVTWNLFGQSGSDRSRPLGRTCPTVDGQLVNYTGIWFPGFDGLGGASVLVDGAAQGQVHYLFDAAGQPRWLLAGGAFPADELALLQFSGFCANCTGPTPTSEEVGVLDIQYDDAASGSWTLDYQFANPVSGGVTRSDNIIKITNELVCANQ